MGWVDNCGRRLAGQLVDQPPTLEQYQKWNECRMSRREEERFWTQLRDELLAFRPPSLSDDPWVTSREYDRIPGFGCLWRRLKRRRDKSDLETESKPAICSFVGLSYCSCYEQVASTQKEREVSHTDLSESEQSQAGGQSDGERSDVLTLIIKAEERDDLNERLAEMADSLLSSVQSKHWNVLKACLGSELAVANAVWASGYKDLPCECQEMSVGTVVENECCQNEDTRHQHDRRVRKQLGSALYDLFQEMR